MIIECTKKPDNSLILKRVEEGICNFIDIDLEIEDDLLNLISKQTKWSRYGGPILTYENFNIENFELFIRRWFPVVYDFKYNTNKKQVNRKIDLDKGDIDYINKEIDVEVDDDFWFK